MIDKFTIVGHSIGGYFPQHMRNGTIPVLKS